MRLADTYEQEQIHDAWEARYRNDPLLDRLNDRTFVRATQRMDLRPGSLWLDAGCGVGDHSRRIRRHGFQCIGVDISATILERARKQNPEMEFRQAPLESLPFPDRHFDAVHCRGVLMHIPEWRAALAELRRVLRPGGYLMVLEANARSPLALAFRLKRAFRAGTSEMRRTADGLEFWSIEGGHPFVHRMADLAVLSREMGASQRFSAEFLPYDILPSPFSSVAKRLNLWCQYLPPRWSTSVVLIAQRPAG